MKIEDTETGKRQSPETLARWKADTERAKKQFADLQKNPHRNLPDTAPARMAWEERNSPKRAIAKKMGKKELQGTKKELTIASKPASFFKNYSGGKSQWMKEQKRAKDYAPGGKYHKDTK